MDQAATNTALSPEARMEKLGEILRQNPSTDEGVVSFELPREGELVSIQSVGDSNREFIVKHLHPVRLSSDAAATTTFQIDNKGQVSGRYRDTDPRFATDQDVQDAAARLDNLLPRMRDINRR